MRQVWGHDSRAPVTIKVENMAFYNPHKHIHTEVQLTLRYELTVQK